MNDHIAFLREFLARFEETGSAVPSSRWAAQALTRPIKKLPHPKQILEVGPGTGVVTERALRDMSEKDHFTICEINPRFMQALKEKLADNPDYIRHKERVKFFEGPVQRLEESIKFDVIICAIPFTNLKVQIVEEIFTKLSKLSHEKTLVTFFEYIGLRKLGRIASLKERRDRLTQIDDFFSELFSHYHRDVERVWLNLTPIKVYTLKSKIAA